MTFFSPRATDRRHPVHQLIASLHPRKINIEPENDDLEDDFPFPGGPYSQVPAVKLPGCTPPEN